MTDARDDVSPNGGDWSCRCKGPARRVLVVDDVPGIRDMISRFLALGGHEAEEAGDGLRAIELLATRPFDVVLMDGRMPKVDGFEATRIIRMMSLSCRNIPIIGITTYATLEEHAKFTAAGMNSVMAKPVDYYTLMRAIADVTATREHGPGVSCAQSDCLIRAADVDACLRRSE